jgi:hypothetical protein
MTLKELSLALTNNTESSINKDKLFIVNGTITAVTPDKANNFELEADDIVNPLAFVTRLRNRQDALSAFIFDTLPQSLQKDLKGYNASTDQEGTFRTLVRELKKITRSGSLYSDKLKGVIPVSAELRALTGQTRSDEETWYINRLILEETYLSEITKNTLMVEVAVSEWIGYENIITYKSLIRFRGVDGFKFFVRKDKDNASADYIPVMLADQTEVWLLDEIYYRQVK